MGRKPIQLISEEHSYLNSTEWLQDLFDHAHDLIQIVHIDGTILFINNAWTKELELNAADIKGRSLYQFIADEDKDRYKTYRGNIINGADKDKSIIFTLVGKGGKRITVEGVVSVKLLDGKPVYTRGIFRNISERILNEQRLEILNEKLSEREYNLQQLLTFAPDAVIVVNVDSRIVYWNPKAERMFGWTIDEVRNKTLSETIIPPQYRAAHEQGMKRYLDTGVERVLNKTVDISALNKNGDEFYVSLTISRAMQQSGTAFVAFLRDISEQKRSQLEIEHKRSQLEETNKRLESFAYAASHDLKQPIRKVQLFLERLYSHMGESMDAEGRDYFKRIEQAAIRMQGLINDLLTYSSLSSDSEFAQEVSLEATIRNAINDFELEIAERQIRVDVGPLPTVKGNKIQLHQLFHNLVSNAVKYAKKSGTHMIKATSVISDGYHVIEVSDNGIGFKEDQSEKIFDIFTRLHTHHAYPGTGVGLAIARKVAENHNGFISASAQENEGATFRVYLPV